VITQSSLSAFSHATLTGLLSESQLETAAGDLQLEQRVRTQQWALRSRIQQLRIAAEHKTKNNGFVLTKVDGETPLHKHLNFISQVERVRFELAFTFCEDGAADTGYSYS
jgi:hypothetical protein